MIAVIICVFMYIFVFFNQVDLSTHYPSIPSRSLPHPGVKPPPHSFPQFSVPSSVIPPRPYLQSESRPLVLRNSREFSPHSEGSDRGGEKGGPFDKIEGLVGKFTSEDVCLCVSVCACLCVCVCVSVCACVCVSVSTYLLSTQV